MLLKNIKIYLNNRYKGTIRNIQYFLKNFSKIEIQDHEKNTDINSDIWIFDSSSKLTRYSLYSAFCYFLTNQLDSRKLDYAVLICASGLAFVKLELLQKSK